MSASALREAAVEIIRREVGLPPHVCRVTDDGQPEGTSGTLFVSVHPGQHESEQIGRGHGRFEIVGFLLTVSVKGNEFPRDAWRRVSTGTRAERGCELMIRECVRVLLDDQGEGLMAAANALIAAQTRVVSSDDNRYLKPPECMDLGQVESRDGSWWNTTQNADRPQGWSQTAVFEEANLVGLAPTLR